jgi:glyoxylase-like metal-dependent hydrolase (beta-lactamase superfamily II)
MEGTMNLQNWYDVKEITKNIYMITEGLRYKSYLLIGSKQALLIDTGTGIGDMKKLVQSITRLDVAVALTHGHWDHVGGTNEFQKAGIHPLDRGLATAEPHPLMHERAKLFIAEWADIGNLFPPNFSAEDFRVKPCRITHELNHGDTIDLGDTRVKVYHTPGHSPGSISLLDETSGILFVGDTVKPREPQYAHLPGSDLLSYASSIEMLASLKEEIKGICSGHTEPFFDPSILAEMSEGFRKAANGEQQPHRVETEWGRLKEYAFERFSIWTK